MIAIRGRKDPRPGRLLFLSLVLHGVVLLAAERLSRFLPPVSHHPIYEVEIVSLPVAEPLHADTPPQEPEPPLPEGVPEKGKRTESLPAPPPRRGAQPVAPPTPSATESAADLERRIKELQRRQEERQLEETVKRLQQKNAPPPPGGTPSGTGTEQGVDYTTWLHGLLSDAFRETITYQSPSPETAVRIIIDGKGRLIGTRIDRRSGDRLFDDAVLRAIGKAARSFRPPPDGRVYEHGFVFKPEGVGR